MSKKPDQFTINITRHEIQWLHRQLMNGRMVADAQIEQFKGPLSDNKTAQLNEVTGQRDELLRLEMAVKDRIDAGDRDRLNIVRLREDLEEAMELNPAASLEIRRRMESLPKEEPYRITFDRETAKFTLQLLEKDLTKFRQHTIPNYEKKPEEDYKDPIQNKTYWVNKAHRAKTILETLKVKIEREL